MDTQVGEAPGSLRAEECIQSVELSVCAFMIYPRVQA